MSWEMWTINGYGIDVSEAGPGKIIKFIKKHLENTGYYKKNLKEVFEDANNTAEIYDGLCECTDQYAAGELIAEIIRNETGIPVYSTGINEDCKEAVLYPEKYPWEMTEEEKALTEDELHQMFERYARELEEEEKPLFIGEQKLYFCG